MPGNLKEGFLTVFADIGRPLESHILIRRVAYCVCSPQYVMEKSIMKGIFLLANQKILFAAFEAQGTLHQANLQMNDCEKEHKRCYIKTLYMGDTSFR